MAVAKLEAPFEMFHSNGRNDTAERPSFEDVAISMAHLSDQDLAHSLAMQANAGQASW